MRFQLMLILMSFCFVYSSAIAQKRILHVPSNGPEEAQSDQIERMYGMFIHIGIRLALKKRIELK